jgi:hypothetical protein
MPAETAAEALPERSRLSLCLPARHTDNRTSCHRYVTATGAPDAMSEVLPFEIGYLSKEHVFLSRYSSLGEDRPIKRQKFSHGKLYWRCPPKTFADVEYHSC